jgi:hypothetical protein
MAGGGLNVVVVAAGGLPVSEATDNLGLPVTDGTHGIPVTIVSQGGLSVVFITVAGVLDPGAGGDPDITAPTFTSSATANVLEGVPLSHLLTADESVVFTITGGADEDHFELSGAILRFLNDGVKDYEAPDDADANNTYVLEITATDPSTNATPQTITITVTNDTGDDPPEEGDGSDQAWQRVFF